LVVPASGKRLPTDILLGRVAGRPWFARPVAELNGTAVGWRDVVTADQDALAAAVALTRWHGLSPACEACGAATVPDLAGARRRCLACGALAFPRTDPCVIVAITDPDDRLLLARQAQWAQRRVSIIAGFIEAGESAEQACHREAFEEVGVRLADLSYAGSQPWPMPRSLMLGFLGRAVDSRIRVDGDEIAEGAYYAREELVAAVAAASVVLPPHASIARGLIERWLSAR
jgi:NAD+ diphosphatase